MPCSSSCCPCLWIRLRTEAEVEFCLALFQAGFGRLKNTPAVLVDWIQERAGHTHVHLGTRWEPGPLWAFEEDRRWLQG